MSDKLQKIYEALVDGAQKGLVGSELYKHVVTECPKATSKKIVKASLNALVDGDLKDENALRVIYDLAIKHRLDPVTHDDHDPAEEVAAPKEKRGPKAPASDKN